MPKRMIAWISDPLLQDKIIQERRFLFIVLGTSLLFHFLTGFFYAGFHNFDEHFQSLEYINALLGRTPKETLTWEYHFHMRSWLQPAISFLFVKSMMFLGIDTPFIWENILRIFFSLLGWVSIVFTTLACFHFFKIDRWRKIAILLLGLLYFFPYIHARLSGENTGGSLFFIAMSLILLRPSPRPEVFSRLLVGFLLGLGFWVRFQTAFLIGGFGLYWIFAQKPKLKEFISCTGGFLIACTLGILTDRWGYGQWVLTPWNYFYENLVNHRVATFGSIPWWGLFGGIFTNLPPISTLLLIAALLAIILQPLNPLSIATVPFMLVHSVITWKELRFIFPAAPMLPLLSCIAMENLEKRGFTLSALWQRKYIRAIVWTFCGFNFLILTYLSILPANSSYRFFKYVYSTYQNGFEIFTASGSPWKTLGETRFRYYEPNHLVVKEVADYRIILDHVKKAKPGESVYFFHGKQDLPAEAAELEQLCKIEYRNYPRWIRHVNINNWLSRTRLWQIFRCDIGDPAVKSPVPSVLRNDLDVMQTKTMEQKPAA